MLLIPLTGGISRRNPPFVTIGLILANVIVYVAFQWNDHQRIVAAQTGYFASGLAGIEMAYYTAYRDRGGQLPVDGKPHMDAVAGLDRERQWDLCRRMRSDEAFMAHLRGREIIRPGDPVYGRWLRLDFQYRADLNRSVTWRFGFRPAQPKAGRFLTYMFLHGDLGHLLGNMVFLWLLGCLLEMGCGRVFYVSLYALTGILSAAAFWAVYAASDIPLVGASGAIAGLMGAFAVLFGRKRVKIFFSLGFYFGYRQVPALLLLPLWLGNEFYQLFLGGVSQVAYVAHIGGLVSGAAMGLLNLKKIGAYDARAIAAEPEDAISPMLETALDHLGKLEVDAGCRLLEAVLQKDPCHREAMGHLFNALKTVPGEERFHRAAGALLRELTRNAADRASALRYFDEYAALARPPRLAPDLSLRLAAACAAGGRPETAEGLVATVIKRQPRQPGLPATLLKLARAYGRAGRRDRCDRCLRIVVARYPGSTEAGICRNLLAAAP